MTVFAKFYMDNKKFNILSFNLKTVQQLTDKGMLMITETILYIDAINEPLFLEWFQTKSIKNCTIKVYSLAIFGMKKTIDLLDSYMIELYQNFESFNKKTLGTYIKISTKIIKENDIKIPNCRYIYYNKRFVDLSHLKKN